MFLSTGMPSRTRNCNRCCCTWGNWQSTCNYSAPLHPLSVTGFDANRGEQKELPLRNDCYWLTITVKNNRNRTRPRLLIDSTSWWRSRPFAVLSFVFKWRVTASGCFACGKRGFWSRLEKDTKRIIADS